MQQQSGSPFALLLLALLFVPGTIHAQGTCSAPSPDCVVVGEWDLSVSLGGGLRTNPLDGESDIPLVLIPQLSYYGKRWFLENLDLGFTLHEGDVHTFNLVATPGYDRVFFDRDDLQNFFVEGAVATPGSGAVTPDVSQPPRPPAAPQEYRAHRRRSTYLAGLEWILNGPRLTAQVSALQEVTGRHDGQEVRAAMALPLIEREQSLAASAGLTWKSAALVQYYYGIERLYQPDSALSPFVKLTYMRPLSDRWSLSAFVHYEHLDGAIADSPLVADDHVVTAFAGFNYKIL